MPTHLIAVVNMKGGVGKSSTVVSLADQLAASGVGRVLVIDVDTQATASYFLAGDKRLTELIEQGKTIDQFLKKVLVEQRTDILFSNFIRERISNTSNQSKQLDVSLIASTREVRASERDIVRALTEKGKSLVDIERSIADTLRKQISLFQSTYEFILFDCAPGISPFTTAAITLADLVLVPTIADAPSFYGLAAFIETVHKERDFEKAKKLPHVVLTRYMQNPKRPKVWNWEDNKGKKEKLQHQLIYYNLIKDLSNNKTRSFKLLEAKLYESPLMPHAMRLGSLDEPAAPTLNQKYGILVKNLKDFSDEIREILT